MKEYQAKTIQKILGMPKHRYDYILMKIGVEPDLDKASGRGKTNLFSFSKLLEFAIANTAMNTGMVPEIIKESLGRIRRIDSVEDLHFFDPDVSTGRLKYYVGVEQEGKFSWFSGEISVKRQRPRFISVLEGGEIDKAEKDGSYNNLASVVFGENFADAEGVVTLNLARIKNNVISKL